MLLDCILLKEPTRSSAIFGGAKPVDTLSKELKIEEKILSQKSSESAKSPAASGESRSASIFGGAKPVDTAAREREIEQKLQRGQSGASHERERERGCVRNYYTTHICSW